MILGWPNTALWCCLASTFKSCNERSQVLNQAVPQNLPFQLHLLPFSSHCMRLPLHFTVMMVLDEWWGDSCQTECFVWQLKTSVLFSSHHRIFCLMLSGLHVLFFFFPLAIFKLIFSTTDASKIDLSFQKIVSARSDGSCNLNSVLLISSLFNLQKCLTFSCPPAQTLWT